MFRRLGDPFPYRDNEAGGATSPPPPAADPAATSPPPASPPPAAAAPPAYSELVKAIGDKDVRGFAERFQTFDELAKGGLDLRRAASNRDGLVKIPTDKASVEEIAQFRKSMGVPETPEAYGIEVPKGSLERDEDKTWWGGLQAIAHKYSVSRAGLGEMAKSFFEHGQNTVARLEQAMKTAKEAEGVKLRATWGPDYERNVGLAQRAHQHYGGEAWDAYAKAVGFADDPVYLQMMARIGGEIAPHNPLVAFSPAEAADNMRTLKEEHAKRAKEGTLNDVDFQKRWAEGWRRERGN